MTISDVNVCGYCSSHIVITQWYDCPIAAPLPNAFVPKTQTKPFEAGAPPPEVLDIENSPELILYLQALH
jgi:hypothetical protein